MRPYEAYKYFYGKNTDLKTMLKQMVGQHTVIIVLLKG
jgi:hypothetical protein